MKPSVYCFVSGGEVNFVPINTSEENLRFIDEPENDQINHKNGEANAVPREIKMKIRNKNLLYKLNNASFSDLDSDSHHEGSNTPSLQVDSSPGTSPSPPPIKNSNDTSGINNHSTHAMYLPEYYIDLERSEDNEYCEVKGLLSKIFPQTWVDVTKIQIKRVTGGITNMLLSCTYSGTDDTVLMRVYGNGTNLIIDRHREFVLHLVLNSLDLAPAVHARFRNGLVYGFLPGRSLETEELQSEGLYPSIAQQLGNWHSKVDSNAIQNGVERLRNFSVEMKRKSKEHGNNYESVKKKIKKSKKRFISNVWELIEDWINIVPITPDLIASFNENSDNQVTEENMREIIQQEFTWLKSVTVSTKSPIVTSHCDLLSGNVIIQSDLAADNNSFKLPLLDKNPVKFIDYEYMLPAPRAFDIANHLSEWQGFDCKREAIPKASLSNPTMVKWVKGYLNNENASQDEVSSLINEIAGFYGMPGFYWGVWAMIQSEISDIDFNYAEYGKSRLQEYWDWKLDYLKNI